ncbi:MAG: glycine zipper 2TM domain-containing protein [Pseudomonadota bacterium]
MNTKPVSAACLLAFAAALAGCASNTPQPYTTSYSTPPAAGMGYGTIDSIEVVRGSTATNGSGAVVGGLVGALAGNQIGSGSGRTAATVAGALGGAVVGNNIEANRKQNAQDMYQIVVRLDNGDYRTLVQDSTYDLRVGNRVRVVDGRAYRY